MLIADNDEAVNALLGQVLQSRGLTSESVHDGEQVAFNDQIQVFGVDARGGKRLLEPFGHLNCRKKIIDKHLKALGDFLEEKMADRISQWNATLDKA